MTADPWAEFHQQIGPEQCYLYPRRDCPGCEKFCIRVDRPIDRTADDDDDR